MSALTREIVEARPTSRQVDNRWVVAGVALLAVAAGVRLWSVVSLPLYPDEAFYWLCSRHLALGYFHGTPLLAWVLRAVTWVLGDGLPAMRLTAFASGMATAALVVALGWRVFGDARVGILAGILYLATPIYAVRWVLVDYDGLQLLFWVASAYAYHHALAGGRWGWWVAAGSLLGLGILAKWTMVLFPLCLLAYLDLSRASRWALRSARLWVSFLVALALVSPLLVWGMLTSQSPFGFILHLTTGAGAHTDHTDTLRLLRHQLVLIGPGVFLLYLVSAAHGLRAIARNWDERYLYTLSLSIPGVAFFFLLSLHSHVGPDWADFCYLTGIVATSAALLEWGARPGAVARAAGVGLLALVLAANVLLTAASHAPHLPGRLGIRIPLAERFLSDLSGWQELAARVEQVVGSSDGQLVAASPDYQVCSVLAYLTRSRLPVYCVSDRAVGAQFFAWQDLESLRGKSLLLITPTGAADNRYADWLKRSFRRVTPLPSLVVTRGNATVRMFLLDRGDAFSGRADTQD